jgi:DNA-binding NtrC family response regulator
MKILIVDDEQVIRDLFTQVLETKGHEVAQAAHGREAVVLVEASAYDLIFIDIIMPDIDGVEVFKLIKKARPNATVVMITGFAVEEKLREAMALGAFDYLYKPFNIVELMAILGKLKKRGVLRKVNES